MNAQDEDDDDSPPHEIELTVDEAVAEAIRVHQQGFVKAAAEIYDRVLKVKPDHVDALHFLGVAALQLGHPNEATQLIRESLKHAPDNADAHNNLGNVLKSQGHLEEAREAYALALELRPDNPQTLTNLGSILAVTKDHDGALVLYKRVLEMAPDYVEAHHNLGNLYFEMGELEGALNAFKTALTLKPYNTEAYRKLGNVLALVGLMESAREIYKKWTEIAPDDPESHHMLAAVSGENIPLQASAQSVKQLFDRFSNSFDQVLQNLGYSAPAIVADTLKNQIGEPQGSLTVLDAGCGTGLGGPLLRPFAKRLVGLDLSDGMIEKARERNAYDEFVVSELGEYMLGLPATYDVVTAIDTFCYIGDLANTARALATTLTPGGHAIFTVERSLEDKAPNGYLLHPHGRYSHTGQYLDDVLVEAGLEVVLKRQEVLRKEAGKPVEGFAVVARRPAA
jgi:predicted TPR repeat methyltransferase